jgi:hypothetical protein
VAIHIHAGTTITDGNGYRGDIFAIVPEGGTQVALIAGSDGQTLRYPIDAIVGMLACGAWTVLDTCPACGSTKVHHTKVREDGAEMLDLCADCFALWSENMSEETSRTIVKPMGSAPGVAFASEPRYFDFTDEARTYRRHGFAQGGVCVQVG